MFKAFFQKRCMRSLTSPVLGVGHGTWQQMCVQRSMNEWIRVCSYSLYQLSVQRPMYNDSSQYKVPSPRFPVWTHLLLNYFWLIRRVLVSMYTHTASRDKGTRKKQGNGKQRGRMGRVHTGNWHTPNTGLEQRSMEWEFHGIPQSWEGPRRTHNSWLKKSDCHRTFKWETRHAYYLQQSTQMY